MSAGSLPPQDGSRPVGIVPLRLAMEQALEGLGTPPDHALQIAAVLLDAELRGYDDHGVYFLGELAAWFRSGALNPAPNITVVQESDSALILDADSGCGVVPSFQAMRWCIERAADRGLAVAALRRSGHFVAAAPYPAEAARHGYIALATANVTPLMPPPGGRTRTLGTNPFCFAAPTGGKHPIVFDMATTAIAGFKVRVAALEGRTLPDGLVASAAGQPTNDPGEFLRGGLLMPIGGHKGFGMALLVEILAGVLSGAQFGALAGVTNGKEGQFFLALNPEMFMPREEFIARMDELVHHIKASETVEGVDEIVLPGERGQRRAAELLAAGELPLNPLGWKVLMEVCESVGVVAPVM
ncbi:MAG: Ldh family oxidoreductase [Chloroflexota bacterium]